MQAARFNVVPLDDRMVERINPDMAKRPQLIRGDTQTLFDGMIGLQENCMLNLKNKSHAVTAQVTIPDGGAHGVIVNEGGQTGGWVLYLDDDGRLVYHYNFLGMQRTNVTSTRKVDQGQHQVRMEFAYDGGGIGKGGTATTVSSTARRPAQEDRADPRLQLLAVRDRRGRRRQRRTRLRRLPSDGYRFTGDIDWVRLEAGTDSQDHLLDPEKLLHFAMSRQ